MKRRYLLGSLIFLSLFTIGTPMVAGNGYSLGVSAGQVFIWQVSIIDDIGLSSSIGSGWATTINSTFGACSVLGARYKYEIVATSYESGNFRVDFKYWEWIGGEFSSIADQPGAWTAVYDDPTDIGAGSPYSKFYSLPVRQFLLGVDYSGGDYYAIDNIIAKRDDSYLQNIECRWIYSETFGVRESFQIRNVYNAIIYEYRLVSAPTGPFDLLGFLLMPAIFVGIGIAIFTVGIVIGKRR